jgi:hypothetical protein
MVLRPWSIEGKRIETIVPRNPIPPMDVGLAWRRNAQSHGQDPPGNDLPGYRAGTCQLLFGS